MDKDMDQVVQEIPATHETLPEFKTLSLDTPSLETLKHTLSYKILNKQDSKHVKPPSRSLNSAGYDLCSSEIKTIRAGNHELVGTGLAFEFPDLTNIYDNTDIVGILKSRSGLNSKHKIYCMAGVIDKTYRGEVKVLLYNYGSVDYTVQVGEKICQMLLHKIYTPPVCEVDTLSASVRGGNGFGSTGKF